MEHLFFVKITFGRNPIAFSTIRLIDRAKVTTGSKVKNINNG